jgi:hypothetical protein
MAGGISLQFRLSGGEGGIRTPDTLSGMPVFKTGAINHSATSPDNYCPNSRCCADAIRFHTATRKVKTETSLHSAIHERYARDQILEILLQQAKCAGVEFHDLGEVRKKISEAVIAGIKMVLMFHPLFLEFVV